MTSSDMVDFRPLKATAMRVLPGTHPLRIAVLAEPDWVPRGAALAKLETFAHMAYAL